MEEEYQTGCDDYPEFVEENDTEKVDSEGNLGNVPVETSKEHEGETIVEKDSNTISSAEKPAIKGNSLAKKTKRIRKLKDKVHSIKHFQ